MKAFALAFLTVFLTVSPTLAVEYQGQNIDGRKLTAKVYSYETAATYDAQVEFNQDQAFIRFPGGGELTVSVRKRTISNLGQVEAYGGPGQLALGNFFTLGFGYAYPANNLTPLTPNPLRNFWRISLDPSNFDNPQP